jgi:DNA-binding LacI/PurR family transcriptional regulator
MITQEQIAKKLGISRQLVTLALTGNPNVSESSRQRISAAAKKMGYAPNPFARALKRGRTGIVALWLPNQFAAYYTCLAREFNRLVKAEGNELIISEVGTESGRQLISHVPMDGIFIADAFDEAKLRLRSAVGNTTPAIYMGAENYELNTDHVHIDLFKGSIEAMEHLISSGHRRILHVTCMRNNVANASRRRAYCQAIKQAGLKSEFLYYDLLEGQRSIVRKLIQEYIACHGKPDAIFCHSDDVALGIYRGLCDLKLEVPRDMAIVGCDGIQDLDYIKTPITTIVQPVTEMCRTAWTFLQQRLASPDRPVQHLTLNAKLVIRESSQTHSSKG